jgi:hypothetical protein
MAIKRLKGNVPPNKTPLYYVEFTPVWTKEDFIRWLGKQSSFPFSIYLNGVTYLFENTDLRDMFIVGFQARDIHDEEEKEWSLF